MDLTAPLTVALVFLLAGACKGVIGLGLPTISVGLLALLMPPAEAASLLILPSLVTNIAQASGPHLRDLLRRLWPMLLALVPGTLAGGAIIASGAAALPALGLALLAYAAWGLATPPLRLPPRIERATALPIGLAGGVVTGATGVFVVPVVPWLTALGLPRDALVQALGLGFLVATLALAGALALHGAVTPALAGGSLLAVAPALLGQWLGSRARQRIPPMVFRRLFFVAMLVLGAQLAWRGLA
ncbi:sulfite exporter TauE/SafE family protein [Falsiroseomonas oryzae]|uniref:sulfite exporter TauE/SafE family protein n=1 Tax=Falsiroseomonas oryzae TaxID=2766473 RepID=UPI0022EAC439|nr:sulfite exporter TauE/SafE family protein [Roseomonas sp. MO-31]